VLGLLLPCGAVQAPSFLQEADGGLDNVHIGLPLLLRAIQQAACSLISSRALASQHERHISLSLACCCLQPGSGCSPLWAVQDHMPYCLCPLPTAAFWAVYHSLPVQVVVQPIVPCPCLDQDRCVLRGKGLVQVECVWPRQGLVQLPGVLSICPLTGCQLPVTLLLPAVFL